MRTCCGKYGLPGIYILLVIVQALHSSEEVILKLYSWLPGVTGMINEATGIVPQLSMSATCFLVLNLAVLAVLMILVPLVPVKHPYTLTLLKIIAIIEMINGLMHLLAVPFFLQYFPGAFTGFLLLIVAFCLLKKVKHEKTALA